VRGQRTEREKQKQKERQKKRNGGKETEKERQNEIDRKREREEKRETEEERQEKRDRKRGQTHHSFRSVKVLLARLSAGGSVLFVLLAVLLLLYNRSAFSALCTGNQSVFVIIILVVHLSLVDQDSPGGFLRMKVHSLCLVSSMPRYPQALQELPMVCFLGFTCWRNTDQSD